MAYSKVKLSDESMIHTRLARIIKNNYLSRNKCIPSSSQSKFYAPFYLLKDEVL